MADNNHLDLSTLEGWLWDAACSIRGPIDAPKYRDYILPLLFYKRLSDVYEDEIARLTNEFGDADLARKLAVVLDTGAVSRESGDRGSNHERDIRA